MPAADVAAWLADLMPASRAEQELYPWEEPMDSAALTSPA
jgi:hypothetical protein